MKPFFFFFFFFYVATQVIRIWDKVSSLDGYERYTRMQLTFGRGTIEEHSLRHTSRHWMFCFTSTNWPHCNDGGNTIVSGVQDSSLQCSSNVIWPFKMIPLSKHPFKMHPQIENEDVTWSPRYNLPPTKTNKCRALWLLEVELDGWFLLIHIVLETRTI